MSLVDIPRNDNGQLMINTDKEIAAWVKYNSILHGTVTAQETENIDWVALIRERE